jgi:glc operon protein GlcG
MLNLAQAKQIVESALARACEIDAKISVAVCNADGRLIALNRMDGALVTANLGSIGKAIASAMTGRPSRETETGIEPSSRTSSVIGEGWPVIQRRGGLPILRGGALEGACGVSGAKSNEEDEDCARSGVAAIAASQLQV